MEPASSGRVTGAYGGDRIPGTYLKTLTGVVRGEELFSRPDLERPWRTADKQRKAAASALKEKEIEELMRLCSNLRTELGNAKSDARFLEYTITERTKAQVEEKQRELDKLRGRVEELEKQVRDSADAVESQIRLLRSQAENEALGFKNEARIATERCVELTKAYQKQIDDVKAAGMREVEFVEARFKARVGELTTELTSTRESHKAAEEHYREQAAQSANMVHKVEADFKERLRASEQRVEEQRKEYEIQLAKLRTEKDTAVADVRKGTEKLAIVLADKEDLLQKQKLWNSFILAHLDTFYHSFIAAAPDFVVEPLGTQLQQVPELYAPRCVLEDPEAKVAVERIAYRVTQLKSIKEFPFVRDAAPSGQTRSPTEAQLDQVVRAQEQLRRALRELEDRHSELDATVSSFASRLYFFSDNLSDALHQSSPVVAPPMHDVVFVCLCVPQGRVLWAADVEMMRSAMQLLYSTLRLKLGEYGGYECYSDDVAMLLAFADAAAACRFCTESQEWLMQLPWPPALLQHSEGQEERASAAGGRVVYRGLRVAMAMHAGEAYVEPSGIALQGSYRNHYYGKAVSQIVHICSLAQGGQVIASAAAWNMCARRKHELGALTAKTLGTAPIVSFNSQTGVQEKQVVELVQVLSTELEGRTFKSPSKATLPPVSALRGVRESVLASEVAAVEAQREHVRDALMLLREECNGVQSEAGQLVARARAAQPHFHVLPPSEMVTQMNDLYGVTEKVAVRAEELYGDLQDVAHAQEELEAQARGIKEFFLQHTVNAAREEDLRTETEAVRQHLERQLQGHRDRHRAEVERMQLALQEKEQMLRRVYQESRTH